MIFVDLSFVLIGFERRLPALTTGTTQKLFKIPLEFVWVSLPAAVERLGPARRLLGAAGGFWRLLEAPGGLGARELVRRHTGVW